MVFLVALLVVFFVVLAAMAVVALEEDRAPAHGAHGEERGETDEGETGATGHVSLRARLVSTRGTTRPAATEAVPCHSPVTESEPGRSRGETPGARASRP